MGVKVSSKADDNYGAKVSEVGTHVAGDRVTLWSRRRLCVRIPPYEKGIKQAAELRTMLS